MNEQEFREKVLTDLAEIKLCLRQNDKDIAEIQSVVYGNGKMGLRTQMTILWGVGVMIVTVLIGVVTNKI